MPDHVEPTGSEIQPNKANGSADIGGKEATLDAAFTIAADAETEASELEQDDRIAALEAAISLDDEDGAGVGAPRSLVVAVGKPPDFFRCHPDPGMSQTLTGLMAPTSSGIGKTFHLVGVDARAYLADYLKRTRLVLCVDMAGDEFLWPISLPTITDSEPNVWITSALRAVERAKTEWVKLLYVEGQTTNGYKIDAALGSPPPPRWSGRSFQEIRNLALADFVINDTQHPVAKRLREGKRQPKR